MTIKYIEGIDHHDVQFVGYGLAVAGWAGRMRSGLRRELARTGQVQGKKHPPGNSVFNAVDKNIIF
jgi:hypothetical protein